MVTRIVNLEHNRRPRKKKTKKVFNETGKIKYNDEEKEKKPSYSKNKQEVKVEFKRKVKDDEVNQDKMMMIKSQKK